jgi:hypothetical protein
VEPTEIGEAGSEIPAVARSDYCQFLELSDVIIFKTILMNRIVLWAATRIKLRSSMNLLSVLNAPVLAHRQKMPSIY